MTWRRIMLRALGAGGLVLLLMTVAARLTDQPVTMLSQNLYALSDDAGAELPFYAGSLNILNGWVWASGAALAFLAGSLLPPRRRWMRLFGLLVVVLAADDALMLHKDVGPDLGVPERAFLALYGGLCLALLAAGRRRWREHTMVAFGLGGALLVLAMGWDLVAPDNFLVEDGAKFLAAVMWLTVPVLALNEPSRTGRGAPERADTSSAVPPTVQRGDGHHPATGRSSPTVRRDG